MPTQTMPMKLAARKLGLHVIGVNHVTDASFKAVHRAAVRLGRVIGIRHHLAVMVVPALTVEAGGGFGFAAFCPDDRPPTIWIAGQRISGMSAAEHRRHLAEHLAHELAHYEQWRDGRKIQERGVAVRARYLMSQAGLFDV